MKNSIQRLFILVPFLFLSLCGSSQLVVSMKDAVSIGLKNNVALQIAQKQIDIAQNDNTWARAGKAPNINLSVVTPQVFTQNNNPVSFIQGIVYNGQVSADLGLQYPIYDGGRSKANKNIFGLEEEFQGAQQATIRNNVTRNIKFAYINAALIKEQIALIEEVLALSKARREYETVKAEFGRSTEFSIRQTQDAIFGDSINLMIQQTNLTNALQNLKFAMNINDNTTVDISDNLVASPGSYLIGLNDNDLRNNNLSLRSLLVQREIAKSNIRLLEATKKPTLSLTSDVIGQVSGAKLFNEVANRPELNQFRVGNVLTFNAGLALTYNIFDGGVRNTNVRSAQMREQIANLQYDNTLLTLKNNLATFKNSYNNQLDILRLNEAQIANAEQNLTLAEERLKVGQLTTIDYRTIQLQYLNTKLQRVNTLHTLRRIEVDMDELLARE